ncbi:MAG: adenosylcobinamide-GDP ribazoletransferase [Methanosarcinales archaeon]|nr:adenosylcobinamide-GDP ribazoletransferase [Methanosarcinales archaeon]
MKLLEGLQGAIGFLTTLPAGKAYRLEQFQQRTYLSSVVGIILGLILLVVATVLGVLLPGQPGIIAVVVIVSIYILTGIHHLDALSDFGDGIAAHGSAQKKVSAMKDVALGTGGAAFVIIYILSLFVVIQAMGVMQGTGSGWFGLGMALLCAEVISKHSMLTAARFGKPLYQGMGSMISEYTGQKQFIISLLISAVVCTAAMGIAGLGALFTGILASVGVVGVSNRHFGGINGDCLGAAHEMGRLAALVTLFLFYAGGLVVWMPY